MVRNQLLAQPVNTREFIVRLYRLFSVILLDKSKIEIPLSEKTINAYVKKL